jgi:hypothetical protein
MRRQEVPVMYNVVHGEARDGKQGSESGVKPSRTRAVQTHDEDRVRPDIDGLTIKEMVALNIHL